MTLLTRYFPATELIHNAVKALIPNARAACKANDSPFAINATLFPHRQIVSMPTGAGRHLSVRDTQRHEQHTLAVMEDPHGDGFAVPANVLPDIPATCSYADGNWVLANESIEVKIGQNGRITSVYDLKDE